MKAIHFIEREQILQREVMQEIKDKLQELGQTEISFSDHGLNCPCINSGAPEHDLHVVSHIQLEENGSLEFNIDDQQCGYYTSEINLDATIETLGQIEDLTKEDFEE